MNPPKIKFKNLKQRTKYRDISWLMPSVDVDSVFARLGLESEDTIGSQHYAYCPDHEMHTGRVPSHPKWSVDKDTGDTFCFTESRGSNLVFTVCRVRDCDPDEAAKWLVGTDSESEINNIHLSGIRNRLKGFRESGKKKKRGVFGLDEIERDARRNIVLQTGYDYFIQSAPNKKSTDITKETVDYFSCFQRWGGYYSGRVIIPYIMHNEIVGFSAHDIFGVDEWLKQNSMKIEKDYRKVLYPLGFSMSECLFGYDEVEKGCEYLFVVEGARDVMKLAQEGFSAVAVLHSDISSEQITQLSKLVPKTVVILMDGDNAGVEATRKIYDKMSGVFNCVKCYPKLGYDPKNLDDKGVKKVLSKYGICLTT